MRQRKRTRRRQPKPLEEFSFLVNKPVTVDSVYLEIRLYAWESRSILDLSGALWTALENPWESVTFPVGRTHNRIRSPR